MMLNRSVDARFCLLRAQVLKSLGEEDEAENEMSMAYGHAHTIGFNAYFSNTEMPSLLNQEQALAQGWREGKDDAEHQEDLQWEVEGSIGSREEWDALSSDEQDAHWDEFHDRCALGVADEMYFYHVMMSMHMVGYVGH